MMCFLCSRRINRAVLFSEPVSHLLGVEGSRFVAVARKQGFFERAVTPFHSLHVKDVAVLCLRPCGIQKSYGFAFCRRS